MTAGRETKRARAPWTAPVWRGEKDGTRGPCLYMTSGREWRRWRKDGEDSDATNGSSVLVLEVWSSALSRKGVLEQEW
jgi:hypothetical protein